MTETKTAESRNMLAVFIHAGCKTDGIRKAKTHDLNGIIIRHVRDEIRHAEIDRPIQVRKRDRMCRFRVHGEKNATGDFIEQHNLCSIGMVCRSDSPAIGSDLKSGYYRETSAGIP